MRFASTSSLVVGLIVSAAVGGCVTAIGITGDTGGAGVGGSTASSPSGSGGAGAMCMPAAVENTLRACTACHSNPPVKGVPNSLMSIADLQKTSPKGGTYADRSIVRMKNASAPMPPDGLLPAAQVAAFEAWVQGGMALEACPGDTGKGAASGTSAGNGAGNTSSAAAGGGTTTSGSGGGAPPATCAQANDTVGCCDTSGTLYYCNGTTMTTQACTSGTVCGWSAANGYYDCVASAGSDPSGTYPKACGGSGSSSSSSSSTGSGGGGGVTWTQLYTGVFGPSGTSSCTGSSCHTNLKAGFKCGTSKTTCYNGFVSSGYLTPGASAPSSPLVDPAQSCLCGSLGGNMPAGSAPCITNGQLTQIKSWLASGAPDN